jgi:flagellar protein FlgJ
MAVTIPSDLVLDVMRNADPARLRKAVAAFEQPAADPSSSFAQVMEETSGGFAMRAPAAPLPQQAAESSDAVAARNFERMVLRNLFEPMMPSAESGAFGEGPSAGIWRALAADEFAGAAAKSGQFGIASLIAAPKEGVQPQWPYFETGPITSFAG